MRTRGHSRPHPRPHPTQASAKLVAKLDKIVENLAALPPGNYDRRTATRVITIDLEAAGVDGPAWLTTPRRAELSAGEAKVAQTPLACRRILLPAPAAAPLVVLPLTADPPPTNSDIGSDDWTAGDGNASDPGSGIEDIGRDAKKRERKVAIRFDPSSKAAGAC